MSILDTYAAQLGFNGGRTFSETWNNGLNQWWNSQGAHSPTGGGGITSQPGGGTPWGAGWSGGLESYPTNPLSTGNIVINAGVSCTINAIKTNGVWTSAVLCSYGNPASGQGYQTPTNAPTLIEWNVKMPDSRYGMWAALWLLPGYGWSQPGTVNGGMGEVDVIETGITWGSLNVNTFQAITYHNDFTLNSSGVATSNTVGAGSTASQPLPYPNVADVSAEAHVYGVVITPSTSLQFYFDGVLIWTTTSNVGAFPYEIIMNIQVAANSMSSWHTITGSNTASTNSMVIYEVAAFSGITTGSGGGPANGPGSSSSSPTLVQWAWNTLSNSGTQVTPESPSTPMNSVGIGNGVLINVYVDAAATVTGMTTTFGTPVFLQRITVSFVGVLEQWWIGSSTGGGNQITCTVSSGQFGIQLMEWSGASGGATAGGTADIASGTAAAITVAGLSKGNVVAVAMCGQGAMTSGPGTGWVDYNQGGWTWGTSGLDAAYQIVPNTGSITASWTQVSQAAALAAVVISGGTTAAASGTASFQFSGNAVDSTGSGNGKSAAASGTASFNFSGRVTTTENLVAQTASGLNGYATTPGTVYSASAAVRALTTARSFTIGITWYNRVGTVISTSTGATFTDSTSTMVVGSVTATAPPGAFFAAVVATVTGATTNEQHRIQQVMFSPGSVMSWSPGGFVGLGVSSGFIEIMRTDEFGNQQFVWGAGYPLQSSQTGPVVTPINPTQETVIYDYECTNGVSYSYQATVLVGQFYPLQIGGNPSGASPMVTYLATGYWFCDMHTPSQSLRFQVTNEPFPSTSDQSALKQYGIGASFAQVTSDVARAEEITITIMNISDDVYTALQTLRDSLHTVWLVSPSESVGRWVQIVGPIKVSLQNPVIDSLPTDRVRTIDVDLVSVARPVS